MEGGAETEVEPVQERYPVRNTWFSKWVEFKRTCSPNLETVEIIVALFTNGSEERSSGPFYHIHLDRQRRGEVHDEKKSLRLLLYFMSKC